MRVVRCSELSARFPARTGHHDIRKRRVRPALAAVEPKQAHDEVVQPKAVRGEAQVEVSRSRAVRRPSASGGPWLVAHGPGAAAVAVCVTAQRRDALPPRRRGWRLAREGDGCVTLNVDRGRRAGATAGELAHDDLRTTTHRATGDPASGDRSAAPRACLSPARPRRSPAAPPGRAICRPAARVPAHRDRQRRPAAGRHPGGAALGQSRRVVVRRGLAHHALGPGSVPHRGPGPAPLGQQRPHDLLLLRRRARGAPRVRHGRAARAPPGWRCRSWRAWPAWRWPCVIYLAFNAGRGTAHGWGVGDVDRHRLRAGRAGPGRPALPRPAAGLHAHGGGRRRPGRARRDRDRLQQRLARSRRCSSAWRWSRSCSWCAAPVGRGGLVYAALRRGRLGRALRVGRRPGRRRAWRIGLLTYAYPAARRRPGARHRPLPPVPRAADPRARARGAHRAWQSAISPNERLAAALPPVDELRHRAAVRAGQRRYRRQRRLPRARLQRRRSRSGSSSATSWASRSASSAPRWLVTPAEPRAGCGRRSAGRRSPAAARSPASASPSRC